MANYNEETQTGETVSWTRSNKVIVSNEYGQVPYISFFEEQKIKLPDGTIVQGKLDTKRNITESFADPTKPLTLLHPVTGEIIGTATYQDIYIILNSLYIQLAKARDLE
jgi:hypothetical protein